MQSSRLSTQDTLTGVNMCVCVCESTLAKTLFSTRAPDVVQSKQEETNVDSAHTVITIFSYRSAVPLENALSFEGKMHDTKENTSCILLRQVATGGKTGTSLP